MKFNKSVFNKKLKKIKLLVNDVDGVLTDGGVYIFDNGIEGKRFSVLDGAGCALAKIAGLKTAWLTARQSELLSIRAKECNVTYLMQGQKKKLPAFNKLLSKTRVLAEEVAYIGDDLVDIPVMENVGLAIAVPNALSEVKYVSHYITKRAGGEGAVREVIELILKAQHQWKRTVHSFQGRYETED